MSDTPEQEPSIEEILSSIRQIISDDDDDEGDDVMEEAVQEPEPEPEPEEDDILDLTEVVGEPPEPPVRKPEPPPSPEPVIEIDLRDAEPEPVSRDRDSILTDHAANAALQGFSSLLGNVAVDRGAHPGGITLEDIVRELMKPMLRDWLDQNLPPMIEKLVREELERLARKAMNK